MSSTEQPTNDLDFGICNDDLSIKIVTVADEKIALKDNEFINPFFSGLSKASQLDAMDEKQLYSTYKHVLVMCMRMTYNNEPTAEKIFNLILTKQDLGELSNYFTLLPCVRKILN